MKVGRIVISGSAALAACGVLGLAPPAVQASSAPAATWAKQAPAAHPAPREQAAMAYDAATGTVVLFGGYNGHYLSDTWTWNGTTWIKQAPAVHPPGRTAATMAYDSATGTVVLFGGYYVSHNHTTVLGDTWTWNGTTWTQQALATSPPARFEAVMADDPATGTVVLFSGIDASTDTWTWDGTTWTHQAPATSPGARSGAVMAYDAATSTDVLFGGVGGPRFRDTWTWDGTTWTQQAPATSPAYRVGAVMAYDAATSTEVLFGGFGGPVNTALGDTWTWDGTAWTRQAPAAHPAARYNAAMAYDAATGTEVLFGGVKRGGATLGDTWTWG